MDKTKWNCTTSPATPPVISDSTRVCNHSYCPNVKFSTAIIWMSIGILKCHQTEAHPFFIEMIGPKRHLNDIKHPPVSLKWLITDESTSKVSSLCCLLCVTVATPMTGGLVWTIYLDPGRQVVKWGLCFFFCSSFKVKHSSCTNQCWFISLMRQGKPRECDELCLCPDGNCSHSMSHDTSFDHIWTKRTLAGTRMGYVISLTTALLWHFKGWHLCRGVITTFFFFLWQDFFWILCASPLNSNFASGTFSTTLD